MDNMLTGPGPTMLGKNASSSFALQESASLQVQQSTSPLFQQVTRIHILCCQQSRATGSLRLCTAGFHPSFRTIEPLLRKGIAPFLFPAICPLPFPLLSFPYELLFQPTPIPFDPSPFSLKYKKFCMYVM